MRNLLKTTIFHPFLSSKTPGELKAKDGTGFIDAVFSIIENIIAGKATIYKKSYNFIIDFYTTFWIIKV